ncbi:MAG: [protein-PII] uridylyltransferase family protein [Actinomycetota bacterium]
MSVGDAPAAGAPVPIARLKDELASLERAYSPGHHGLWSARRRSELVDAALVEMYEAATSAGERAPRTALVALGGYGRGALCPHSDIDLLLLHDAAEAAVVAALTEQLLYPLWDAGFAVGHAVRSPNETVQLAAERLDAATALLDARLLAGDAGLLAAASDPVRTRLRGDAGGFAERLASDARERRQRFGSTAYLLEPELKEGGGGLRDIHAFGWLQAVRGRPLEDDGVLRAAERGQLEAAEEFLTRVRSALHLESGRRTDRLIREQQHDIANVMGFQDEPRLMAEDGLMRAVFEHARAVDALTEDVIIRGRRTGGSPDQVELSDAGDALALIAGAAEHGRPLSPAELDAVEAIATSDELEWSDAIRDAFLRILRAGAGATDGLHALDRTGLLVRLIPEWLDVRCRPQRDPYHRYTVDVHLLRAFDRMSRALAAPDADDPLEVVAAGHVDERDGALLGALLHDVGKNGEGGHVLVGDRLAATILARMDVEGSTGDLARFMVAEHLLLPDTATRRDLGDDDLILDVAARVETPERLAALYLLAKADALATGPSAWTPWRQTLIRELVAKVQRVFERGEMGVEVAERLTDAIDRIRDLLHGEPSAEVERFILRMPRSYFLSIPPAQIARHYSTIGPDLGRHDVRTSTQEGGRSGTYELLVVAADRPGLLSWIAGALSLAGLSILTAKVFTTEDGVAADLFEVQGAFEPVVGEERWREFRSLLRKAIDGRVSLEHRMTEKRRHYPERSDTPVTVAVDNDASDFFTVIEIGAPDRIGLLYDITRTLSEMELDVHLAKVATYTDRVIDAFYVRDSLGRKLQDAQQTAMVESAMRARLEGDD